MKIQPLSDRVVLKRDEMQEQKTSGGIVIPDSAKEKPQECKVVAVGPGKLDEKGKRTPPEVKVGDRALIAKWGGTEIKVDGEEFIIVSEEDILAKIV